MLEANKPIPLPPIPTPVVVQAPLQASGITSPKIDVPTFDGNMLHCMDLAKLYCKASYIKFFVGKLIQNVRELIQSI